MIFTIIEILKINLKKFEIRIKNMKNSVLFIFILLAKISHSQDEGKGLFTTYYSIKSIETQGYLDKNGEKDGVWKEFYKSGELHAVKNYKSGLLNGYFLILNKDGDTTQLANYENDKLHGKLTEYGSKGNKTEEKDFKNGKLDGVHIIYYKEGPVNEKINYMNGKLNGKLETFYPDGKPLAVQQYDMDKPIGDFIIYDKSGVARLQDSFGTGKSTDTNTKTASTK
jgi:uncharacterized protein